MTTLRTAAQQALEALENPWAVGPEGVANAITALRAALAEPESFNPDWDRIEPLQENLREHMAEIQRLRAKLAEPCPCGDRPAAQCPGEWEPGCDLGNNPKYAKRVNLAEPVAWMYSDDHERMLKTETFCTVYSVKVGSPDKGVTDVPVYTSPPQRKPLTVMELQDALIYSNLIDPDAVNDPEGYDEGSTLAQIDELHRAIERAHGIT